MSVPFDVFELAVHEHPDAPALPGSVVIERDAFRLWFAPPIYPGLAVVRGIRAVAGEEHDVIESARACARERGIRSLTWWLTPLTTPAGFEAALGLAPEESVVAMARRTGVGAEPGSVVRVTRVGTGREYRTFLEIQAEAFGHGEGFEAAEQAFAAEEATKEFQTYLGWLDGEPVSTIRATFTPAGVSIGGGATLPRAQRRGACRTLLRAVCSEANARGIEWAVAQANPKSEPVVRALGFDEVGRCRIFTDTLTP